MFATIKTLVIGANARAEERVRDVYSIELIDQKIREAMAGLKAAKATLASLIQRQRAETRQIETLEKRAADMLERAQAAMDDGRKDLAQDAAQAVAHMENELAGRRETCDRLERRIMQLRQSIETANRRIIDLKQGAISARAVRKEQGIQRRLRSTIGSQSAIAEAEELIADVMGKDDPFEQGEILDEIERGLNHETLDDQLAARGYGPATRTTADDILSRLKTTK